MPKDTNSQRKNFKIYQNKPLGLDKHMKTEPDEVSKINISGTQNQKSKILTAKYEI
jgi:hypothetical protein